MLQAILEILSLPAITSLLGVFVGSFITILWARKFEDWKSERLRTERIKALLIELNRNYSICLSIQKDAKNIVSLETSAWELCKDFEELVFMPEGIYKGLANAYQSIDKVNVRIETFLPMRAADGGFRDHLNHLESQIRNMFQTVETAILGAKTSLQAELRDDDRFREVIRAIATTV